MFYSQNLSSYIFSKFCTVFKQFSKIMTGYLIFYAYVISTWYIRKTKRIRTEKIRFSKFKFWTETGLVGLFSFTTNLNCLADEQELTDSNKYLSFNYPHHKHFLTRAFKDAQIYKECQAVIWHMNNFNHSNIFDP